MTQSVACLLLALSTALSCAQSASAPPTPADSLPPAQIETAQSAPEESGVYVNSQNVPDARAVAEDGVTYVSAYQVALALCPDTVCVWEGDHMALSGTGFAMTVQPGASYVVCNDRYLYVPGQVCLHDGTGDLLVPVRVLAKALGAQVSWDPSGVYLTPGTPLESGAAFYNAQDVDLIARVIQHESGNQPLEGKIGVANVILNRVGSSQFPNTVSGVLNQKNQFPGATNSTPKAQAIIAAKLAMDGANTVGNACWFNGVGKTCWASKNKSLTAVIGNHAFYG